MAVDSVPHAPSDGLIDAVLVVRVRKGELDALDHLFTRYAPSLLQLTTRLTGSLTDGEDVVQDVFVGLPRALRAYDERGQFPAWLRRVTARTALMALRRISHRNEVPLTPSHDLADVRASPDGILAIEEAIHSLPDKLRAVFVLCQIENYSHEEIAGLLDIRVGTSEVRLYRAIRHLRHALRNDP